MLNSDCYHCGATCNTDLFILNEKSFCCNGCKTVYELLVENDMTCYYDFESNPGAIPKEIEDRYEYLSKPDIQEKLLEFSNEQTSIVNLYIPHIHCSSCIWILENLRKLNPDITSSTVDFLKKEVRVQFHPKKTSLKEVVLLLSSIGYEPYISLENLDQKKETVDRSLHYKLGVAGFAFGNVMFLSFPEYFEVSEFWLEQYKHVFRWLMLAFSLPVVFYAAEGYFKSAYKGLSNKILNIDIPIALGILVLFIRSTVEVIFDLGTGFFDSLTGLVFFLLVGKYFQQKTYSYLSFERDYKSYFPIAVTKIFDGKEESIQVKDVEAGDRLLIRNQELIPVDGILIKGEAQIDYSFVTGESQPVQKYSGDKIFAGGKQIGGVLEMEVLKSVSQSYLTQLWSNSIFSEKPVSNFRTVTDAISKHFTLAVLLIATVATSYWLIFDSSKALNVFTAVLIIACPCAIALAAPFTLGNMLRIFGQHKFYLKNTQVIEKLAKINTILFDKTGTITNNQNTGIRYSGIPLNENDLILIKSSVRTSNHPLSRKIDDFMTDVESIAVDKVEEFPGEGIQTILKKSKVKIGSEKFVGRNSNKSSFDTSIHVSVNGSYKGKFTVKNTYREGLVKLMNRLKSFYKISIISGDNDGEKNKLEALLPRDTELLFKQNPENKLAYVARLQEKNEVVAMIGDGLNDAGALLQSNVGIAVSEDTNVFSPACDAILDANQFQKIPVFFRLSKEAIRIIHYCFVLSFLYNIIGLYFAVTGQLEPVIAAILMPLSSISVVVFTTIFTNIKSKKLLS